MRHLNPTTLLRIRDGVYAADLLTVAVVELDVVGWLATHGPCSEARLCAELGLAVRPCDVMITYLVALAVLQRDGDGRLSATTLGASLLSSTSPTSLGPYFASLRERPACAELLRVLRTGEPVAWASADTGTEWTARLEDPEFASRITAAMDARGALLAPLLADTLADLPFASALDIGGGPGVYARALLARRADLRAAVLERAPVDHAARTILLERGETRLAVITGDMFADALPGGFELHLFSHVLHDWPEREVRRLFAASFAALPPGGWLVDHDTHLNDEKTGPLAVAEYSVLLMHSTHGRCWSVAELSSLMADAGFTIHDHRATGGDRAALIAHKPD
jgi:hypothetical protein